MNDENTASAAGDDNNVATTANPATSANGDQDFSALQNELEDTKTKLAELTQISQHALADLQNFKKRSEEEKAKFIVFANSLLITELLPVLDNIDRAIVHLPEDPAAREWANGILAIIKQLEKTLKKQGMEKIPVENQTFDPNFHEAVMTQPGEKDLILQEMEKGYKIQDRVLRRSKVVVGNGESLAATDLPPQTTADENPK